MSHNPYEAPRAEILTSEATDETAKPPPHPRRWMRRFVRLVGVYQISYSVLLALSGLYFVWIWIGVLRGWHTAPWLFRPSRIALMTASFVVGGQGLRAGFKLLWIVQTTLRSQEKFLLFYLIFVLLILFGDIRLRGLVYGVVESVGLLLIVLPNSLVLLTRDFERLSTVRMLAN